MFLRVTRHFFVLMALLPSIAAWSAPLFGDAIPREQLPKTYALLEGILTRLNRAFGQYAREVLGDNVTRREFSSIELTIEDALETNAATRVLQNVADWNSTDGVPLQVGFTLNLLVALEGNSTAEAIDIPQHLNLTADDVWALRVAGVLAHEVGHHVEEWVGVSRVKVGAEASQQGVEAAADFAGARLLELAGYPPQAMLWAETRLESLQNERASGGRVNPLSRMAQALVSSHPRGALRTLFQEMGLTIRRYRGARTLPAIDVSGFAHAGQGLDELRAWYQQRERTLDQPYSASGWTEQVRVMTEALDVYLKRAEKYSGDVSLDDVLLARAALVARRAILATQRFIDRHASQFTDADINVYLDSLGLQSSQAPNDPSRKRLWDFMVHRSYGHGDPPPFASVHLPRPSLVNTPAYTSRRYQEWLQHTGIRTQSPYLLAPGPELDALAVPDLRDMIIHWGPVYQPPVDYVGWVDWYLNRLTNTFSTQSVGAQFDWVAIKSWREFGHVYAGGYDLERLLGPGHHGKFGGVAIESKSASAIVQAYFRGEKAPFRPLFEVLWALRGRIAFFDLIHTSDSYMDWPWIFEVLGLTANDGWAQLSTEFQRWVTSEDFLHVVNALNNGTDSHIDAASNDLSVPNGPKLVAHYAWLTSAHVEALMARLSGRAHVKVRALLERALAQRSRVVQEQSYRAHDRNTLRLERGAQSTTAVWNGLKPIFDENTRHIREQSESAILRSPVDIFLVQRLEAVLANTKLSRHNREYFVRRFVTETIKSPAADLTIGNYVELIEFALQKNYVPFDFNLVRQMAHARAGAGDVLEVCIRLERHFLPWLARVNDVQQLVDVLMQVLPGTRLQLSLSATSFESGFHNLVEAFVRAFQAHASTLSFDQAVLVFERLSNLITTPRLDAFFESAVEPRLTTLDRGRIEALRTGWLRDRRWRNPEIVNRQMEALFGERLNDYRNRSMPDHRRLEVLLREIGNLIYGSAESRDQFLEGLAQRLQLRDGWEIRMLERLKTRPLSRSRRFTVEALSGFAEVANHLTDNERHELIQWLSESGHVMLPQRLQTAFRNIVEQAHLRGRLAGDDPTVVTRNMINHLLMASLEERVPIIALLLRGGAHPLAQRSDFSAHCARLYLQYEAGSSSEKALEAFFEVIPSHERVTTMAYAIANRSVSRAAGLRSVFEVFTSVGVKVGQLAALLNIFGLEISRDLAQLKDRAPPMTWAEIFEVLNDTRFVPASVRSLIDNVEEILGSASIKTVILVRMNDGARRVMLLQRPEAAAIFRENLRLARQFLAALARKRITGFSVRFLNTILDGLESTSAREFDFREEAAAIRRAENVYQSLNESMREALSGWRFEVPSVVSDFPNGRHFVVTERALGVPFHRLVPEVQRVVGPKIAEAVLRSFFEHGWVYPDPHVGNFLVDVANSTIHAYDFGQNSEAPRGLRSLVAQLAVAMYQNNIEAIVDVGLKMATVNPSRRRGGVDAIRTRLIQRLTTRLNASLSFDLRVQTLLQVFVDVGAPLDHVVSFGVIKGFLVLFKEAYVEPNTFGALFAEQVARVLQDADSNDPCNTALGGSGAQ